MTENKTLIGEVTATIKTDARHDATWLVFKGQPIDVRESIIQTFGLNREAVESNTLAELSIIATASYQASAVAYAKLGAIPLNGTEVKAPDPADIAATAPVQAPPAATPTSETAVVAQAQETPQDTSPPWEEQTAAAWELAGLQATAGDDATGLTDPIQLVVDQVLVADGLAQIQEIYAAHPAEFADPRLEQAVALRRSQLGL